MRTDVLTDITNTQGGSGWKEWGIKDICEEDDP